MIRPPVLLALTAVLLAGCEAPSPGGTPSAPDRTTAPAGAPAGSCWGKVIEPALIETVTEQVLVAPEKRAEDGSLIAPARYKSRSHQRILRDRRLTWFETPCPAQITPEVLASLQRALTARGFYDGPIDGRMSAATSAGLRRYQAQNGLDSDTLSLDTALDFGIISVPRPATD